MNQYKIRLESGRVLGPIDLARIQQLILRKHIKGNEFVRRYPSGDWQHIGQCSEISELILLALAGKLSEPNTQAFNLLEGVDPYAATKLLTEEEAIEILTQEPTKTLIQEYEESRTIIQSYDEAEATVVADIEVIKEKEPSRHAILSVETRSRHVSPLPKEPTRQLSYPLANESTVMIGTQELYTYTGIDKNAQVDKKSKKSVIITICLLIIIVFEGYDDFFKPKAPLPKIKKIFKFEPIRPRLPAASSKNPDPKTGDLLYKSAIQNYILDNELGYRQAENLLLQSATTDPNNVKALAMLASTYINLFDSSNKDENTFTVINKLIELSRSKSVDLVESVIADVEFFLTIGKTEAAQNRMVEYTKTHKNFGTEMFYYLALTYFYRGDNENTIRYLSQIPDQGIFSPKVFYLKGQVAEKVKDINSALSEYLKAVQKYPKHAKSRLRIVTILENNKKLQEGAVHLAFLGQNLETMGPRERAEYFYLNSKLHQLHEKWDDALVSIEKAAKIEKNNSDYLLELYQVRSKIGQDVEKVRKYARMYFFLGEGEKLVKQGEYQEALNKFLEARKEDTASPVPLIKTGDMFLRLNDVGNARKNYQLAAEKVPNDIEVWSKYIYSLIQSFEWEDAMTAMDRFRKLPVSQSSIDKAAGDLYAKQGRYLEAQGFYKRAMGRMSIDSDVYLAYGKSLLESQNFKEAPFFLTLALRFDPGNTEAIIGISKAIAGSESIDRAISMLQEELRKGGKSRAEYLAAIAQYQIQKGDWSQAQKFVDLAMEANAEYALPWKLQGLIYMNREERKKGIYLDLALSAFKSYSDRNYSDPSGYLERYQVFVKKTEFEKANDELAKIFSIYPKYPNLHYYKGALYSIQGNHKAAIEEYKIELKNHVDGFSAMLALGKEYIEISQVQDALTLFNRCMQKNPRSGEPKHWSGYANYLLKNYVGAIALYKAALEFDAGNPLIYKRMGQAYREMGDTLNARQSFKRYLEVEPDAKDRAEYEKYL